MLETFSRVQPAGPGSQNVILSFLGDHSERASGLSRNSDLGSERRHLACVGRKGGCVTLLQRKLKEEDTAATAAPSI